MLENVTEQQLKEMRHALGLDYKNRPYRNRYYCSTNNVNWNDLVDKELARKLPGWESDSAYYKLTFEAAKAVYGKRMSKKYYNEL
jgi:hypothetical protein